MKTILSAALVLGLCGLVGARDEKADPVGTWKCEYEIGGLKRTFTLTIKKDGDKLADTMSWPDQKETNIKDLKPLDGIWLSDGYGMKLEIKGGKSQASEITSISCIPDWTGQRQAEAADGAEAVFLMSEAPVKILVSPGSSADHKFFRFKGTASSVGIRRV